MNGAMKSRLAALAGVVVGVALLLVGGGGAPAWLSNLQAAFFCSLALLYGFGVFSPSAPAWLASRPVMGIASIYAGVAVMLVPANVVASSFFLGLGVRLLMSRESTRTRVVQPGTDIVRRNGEIIIRETPLEVR